MGEEGVDFRLSHFRRVTNLMEEYEPPDPMTIGLLRAAAVMTREESFPKTVHEFRLPVRFRHVEWTFDGYVRTYCYGASFLHGLLPPAKAIRDYHLPFCNVKLLYR